MRNYAWWPALMIVVILHHHSPAFSQQEQPIHAAVSNFHASLLPEPDSTVTESGPELQMPSKSRGKAFLFSFLVPGAGEAYLGDKKMAILFFGTEVVLWSTYILLNWYGDLKAEDYKLYAAGHAGVQPRGKNHEYFVNIEDYENLAAYNNAMLQERRPENLYPEDGSYDWSWDSKTSMDRFERMRLNSDRFRNAGTFILGGVLLNHLVSGIDAVRIARKTSVTGANRGVHVHFAGLPEGGMRVTLWKQF